MTLEPFNSKAPANQIFQVGYFIGEKLKPNGTLVDLATWLGELLSRVCILGQVVEIKALRLVGTAEWF